MNLISNLLDRCSLIELQATNITRSMGQTLNLHGLYDPANDLNSVEDPDCTRFHLSDEWITVYYKGACK